VKLSKLIIFIFIIPSSIFSQEPKKSDAPPDSVYNFFINAINRHDKQLEKLDSLIQESSEQRSTLIKIADNNIRYAENLINAQEIIVEFIALLLTVFSILGIVEIRKVNKTRRRLDKELSDLQIKSNNIRNEFDELKKSLFNENKELLQILFYITEGDNSVDAERLEEAINWYIQALKVRENNPEVYAKLGYAYVKTGEYTKAISYLEKGEKLFPKNISILNGLARAHRKSHKFEIAESYYKKALDIDDQFLWSLSGLGQVYLQQERFEEAEMIYQKITLQDTSYHPLINLAIIYACKNTIKKSEEYFTKALNILDSRLLQSHDNKWLIAYKGVVLAGLSKFKEATDIFINLKSSGIFPPAILSIKDRLNVLYKSKKDRKILALINIFNEEK